jgi:uncharacterized protein YdiU (UPF0061 family)
VGLGDLDDSEWVDHFARFSPLPDNLPRPLALRYHGYQFQHYNPHLGDGRGFLFGQLRDPVDGRLLDLGTKGSGKTPYSRTADGRLTLKGGVREVLASEMLEALGVYTSKTFSLVETGESLIRSDEPSPTRSSVLVRLSHGHIRFGTFERQAHEGQVAGLVRLVDFTLEHYFPSLAIGAGPARLFEEICDRSARLCAEWMAAGFVHGVLNTDNMNVTGESFDYGPWRFLPHLDPNFTAAYFDHSGLYAYGRQPMAVRWNLERLAEALRPILPASIAARALVEFEARYLDALSAALLGRLGVERRDRISDALLSARVLCFLERSRLPFDRLFYDWYGGEVSERRALDGPFGRVYAGNSFLAFRAALKGRAPVRSAALEDRYFQRAEGPTTMRIDEVERVYAAIAERDDWQPLADKIADVRALGRLLSLVPFDANLMDDGRSPRGAAHARQTRHDPRDRA